jgi:hypothetical protein
MLATAASNEEGVTSPLLVDPLPPTLPTSTYHHLNCQFISLFALSCTFSIFHASALWYKRGVDR